MLAIAYVVCTLIWIVEAVMATNSLTYSARMRRVGCGIEALCALSMFVTPGILAKVATAIMFQFIIMSVSLAGLYQDAYYRVKLQKMGVSLSDEESESTEIAIYETKRRKVVVTEERADHMASVMLGISTVFLVGMLALRICLIWPNYGAGGWTMFYIVMATGGLGGVAISNDVYENKINQKPDALMSTTGLFFVFMLIVMFVFAPVQGIAGLVHMYMDSCYEEENCYEKTTEWTLDPLDECAYFKLDNYTLFPGKYDGQTFYLREIYDSSHSYVYFSREQDAELQEIPYYDAKLFFDDDPEAPSTAWIVMHETCYKAPLSGKEQVASTEYEIHIPSEKYILDL